MNKVLVMAATVVGLVFIGWLVRPRDELWNEVHQFGVNQLRETFYTRLYLVNGVLMIPAQIMNQNEGIRRWFHDGLLDGNIHPVPVEQEYMYQRRV